jgi:AcrR family transcriptional regulator
MSSSPVRGRRPAGSDTKAAIEAAARRRFAEVGYPRTTMRAVAADAGVDPRLISHFFGSKQELFVAVLELPFDPEPTFEALLSGGDAEVGARLAEFVLSMLDRPQARSTVLGVIRAAASEEAAAEQIRQLLATRLLVPLARRVGANQPHLRAAMVASQVVGLTFARHVVGFPALVAADRADLAQLLAKVFDVYLLDRSTPEAEGTLPGSYPQRGTASTAQRSR